MKILGIGYGRHLFDITTFEHKRLHKCAGEVESFDQIIFTLKSEGFSNLNTENNFRLHPTNSANRFLMLFDAIKIGNQIIKKENCTVITTQDLFETGFVGFILKQLNKKATLQVQEHGDVLSSKHWRIEKFSNRLRYHFGIFILRQADIIRVVSERTRSFIKSKVSANKKIHKFPVVIDSSKFLVTKESSPSERDKYFTFITAARFVPQKNFSLMINAFSEAYKKNNSLRLKIFGEGYLQSDIENLITKLGLQEAVELHGWTEDLGSEMQTADAYLLTSNYEGWARVLIEAMVLRLPIVTTDVGCVGEVVKSGIHGLVVPIDNKQSLTTAIERISSDKRLYAEIKDNLSKVTIDSIPGTNIDTYARDWALTMQ